MNFTVEFVAKPAVILFGAALLSPMLRRCSASVRHAVWLIAITCAVLLPLVSVTVPRIDLPLTADAGASVTFLTVDTADQNSLAEPASTSSPAFLYEGLEQVREGGFDPAVAWFAAAAFLSLRLVIGAVWLRLIPRTAAANDASWSALLKELSSTLGIRKTVRLVFSEEQTSPMTWGLLRHTILLPKQAFEWSEERRRMVLTHELAHVKRNDGFVQVFVQAACSIYWFNPLMWYAARRIRVERERACDDYVLGLGTAAADYADHLVQIVRGLRPGHGFSFAAVSMAQPSQLETRLISILDWRATRRTLSKRGAIGLSALAGLITLALGSAGVTAAVPLPPVLVTAIKSVPPAAAPGPAAKPAAAPQRTRIGNAGAIPNNAVNPPQVLQSRPPLYTGDAVRSNIEGVVTLEAAVNADGKVTILRVVKGLGHGLDEKAKQAVSGWKFGPATRNGVPVEAITQIDVEFRIPGWFDPPQDDVPAVSLGPGVHPPEAVFRVEPEYTEEARKEKYQGTVVARATVHQDGRLTVGQVVQELDYGLTPKAIEALEMWRFKPAMRDGKAVPVTLNIAVHFILK